MVLFMSLLAGCVPSSAHVAETGTVPVAVTAPSFPETTPTIEHTQPPTPTHTLVPITPTTPPSATLTPKPMGEVHLLTFTAWENNTSYVYALSVGCLEEEMPCFGELKLLFEVQGIEILQAEWSPDGKHLAFLGIHKRNAEAIWDIFVIDADGQNRTNLTNISEMISDREFRAVATNPLWSPDSQTLAYSLCNVICEGFATHIATGKTTKLLEKLNYADDFPFASVYLTGWSPTGERLAILIDDLDGNGQVCSSNLDGTDLLQITNTVEQNYSASYSPDGQWLLINRASSYSSIRYSTLFLVRLDGSKEVQLTNSEIAYYNPVWSLDSQWIAVDGQIGMGADQIMLINLAGDTFYLDLEPGKYSNPAWQPAPTP